MEERKYISSKQLQQDYLEWKTKWMNEYAEWPKEHGLTLDPTERARIIAERFDEELEELRAGVVPFTTIDHQTSATGLIKHEVVACMLGPKGTPYDNGIFLIDIKVPSDYPFKRPRIVFRTPILHPQIENPKDHSGGDIAIRSLLFWLPEMRISGQLQAIRDLLSNPAASPPVNPWAAYHFWNDPDEYYRLATELTKKEAM